MTPLSTVNLLRVLFVTTCGVIGALVSTELIENLVPGLLFGVLLGLCVVLLDRLLNGFTLRAFSSATFGLFLRLIFSILLSASHILLYHPSQTLLSVRLVISLV